MRVIVCGSRHYTDRDTVHRALSSLSNGPHTIISGACPTGADAIAEDVAHSLGYEVIRYPAPWSELGRSAGPLRNRETADDGADLCIAFGDGKGTRNMCYWASRFGIATLRYP